MAAAKNQAFTGFHSSTGTSETGDRAYAIAQTRLEVHDMTYPADQAYLKWMAIAAFCIAFAPLVWPVLRARP